MIRVRDLQKRFGSTLAVDGISFEVQRGQVVGFLGPNGAGKTTTIRILTCFHPATAGSAEVAGFDVAENPVEVRRNIGYLPENVPIYPDLRVEEYLRYRAALKGVARRLRRPAVERAMERCGVVEVRKKLVGHVSRGYRQRVGLADALVANPPQEHTILFSSHILAEVEDVSSRILIIDRGRIRADGVPRELLATSRGRRLAVTARASAEELAACVVGQPGVLACSGSDGTDGYATVHADVAVGADPRDDVAAAVLRADLLLRELRLDLPSLEEFFRQMTEGAPGDERTAPAEMQA
jgi:ABC-2 type transport system ATP-binding protein